MVSLFRIKKLSYLVNVRRIREVENSVVKEYHKYVLRHVVRCRGCFLFVPAVMMKESLFVMALLE